MGAKVLAKVTFVMLLKIEVCVSSIRPVTTECLNKLPKDCNSFLLKSVSVLLISVINSDFSLVVLLESYLKLTFKIR